MSIAHKQNYSVSSDSGGGSLSGTDTEVGGTEITIDQSFPASSTNTSVAVSFTVSALQSFFMVADRGMTVKTNGSGTNEVQTITITGTPNGGTFSLAYNGEITSPLAYNASSTDVQTALRALTGIGATGVNCGGGALPGTAVTATFVGPLAATNVPLMTCNNSLTGGSGPAISVTSTTPGLPSNVFTLVAGIPLVWGKSSSYYSCPFTVDVTGFYVTCTPACRLQVKILHT